MTRTRSAFLVVNIVLLAALILIAQGQSKSAVGTWKLDTSKSDFAGMPAPKEMTVTVTQDTKDKVAWKANGVGPDGKKINETFSGPVNGKPTAVKGSPMNESVAYTRNEDGTVTAVTSDKDGKEVARSSFSWSEDGKTMTNKGTRKGPNGDVNYTEVFNKVK